MSQIFNNVEVSHNDKRQYRYIVLPNKLRALLICDPDTEKSSCACDVKVGSMCDPQDVQGLAHFLEHMLFMGTEKYPIENEYSTYLSAHGGFSNAFTGQEDTVYYFDVQNDFFEGALDRFAAFFSCPLFTEAATFREMNAVDNENTKNLQADSWRHFQLLKSLASCDHPFSMFSTGNLETLKSIPESKGLNIREELLKFHERYYSSNVMTVAVYGPHPLDELQAWVEQKFSAIKNADLAYPSFSSEVFRPQDLSRIVSVVPVKDTKTLDLVFAAGGGEPLYLSKPMRYISHLLGHESSGSILSYLKSQAWANSLSAGTYQDLSNFSCFRISIGLTNEGISRIEDILAVVFAYVGLVRKTGAQLWIAEEVQDTDAMQFRYLDKIEPSDYVVQLVENMHVYSVQHVVSGSHLVFALDLKRNEEFFDYFMPANCIASVLHKGLEGCTDSVERWYGTKYSVKAFSEEQKSLWSAYAVGEEDLFRGEPLIHLPEQNPFIPKNFDLYGVSPDQGQGGGQVPALVLRQTVSGVQAPVRVNDDKAAPPSDASDQKDEEEGEGEGEGDEVEEEEGGDEPVTGNAVGKQSLVIPVSPASALTTWFLQDSKWLVPKANVFVRLETNMAYSSPLHVGLCDLFAKILKDKLNESTYYADCAGLLYSIQNTNVGLELVFSGYNDKLDVLLRKTLSEMYLMAHPPSDSLPCSHEVFGRIKEKLCRDYFNYIFWQPYNHATVGTANCVEDPRWTNAEKHVALTAASMKDFASFCTNLVSKMHVEVLVHGNATAEQSSRVAQSVLEILHVAPLPSSCTPIRRVVALDRKVDYIYRQHSACFNPEELNSAVDICYFIAEEEGRLPSSASESSDLIAKSAMLSLVAHLLSEPAFDQLRTKEQLGYIVHASASRVSHANCLRFIVQSNHKDPVYLDGRVESFILQYVNEALPSLTAEAFAENVAAVIANLVEKPKNLDAESREYWAEINSSLYLFQRKTMMSAFLSTVQVADVAGFFQQYILPGAALRSKFSSQFFGRNTFYPESEDNASSIIITDPSEFKRSMSLRPSRNFIQGIPVNSILAEK